jgi:lysophospholipase L1-like esterase
MSRAAMMAMIARRPSVAFAPEQVAGLQVWLDTSEPNSLWTDAGKTTLAVNGNAVYTWSGSHGTTIDATQATSGNRPVMSTGANGLTALTMDGTASIMTLGNPTAINFGDTDGFTIFIVFQPTTGDWGRILLSKTVSAGGTSERIQLTSGASATQRFCRYVTELANEDARSLRTYNYGAPNLGVHQQRLVNQTAYNSTSGNIPSGAVVDFLRVNSHVGNLRYRMTSNDSAAATSNPWIVGGWPTPSGMSQKGKAQLIGIYNRILTQAEVSAVSNFIAARHTITLESMPTSAQVVYDGNSLVYGVGASSSDATIPYLVYGLQSSKLPFKNLGVGALYTTQMTTDGPARIDPLFSSAYAKNILLGWEGSNGMNATASVTYNDLATYYAARKAAGWYVIVTTVLPRGTTYWDSSMEAARIAVNAYLRANYATFGHVLCDIGGDSTIGVQSAASGTTYYADHIHLNDAGYAIAAPYVKTSIDTVLAM